ncbi:MAG: aldehyde dehydrogenase family protein, partial [Flavobacteriaceae bacterium]
IVDGTTPLQKTAKRIVWGKFLNCGQTCIAPDYLLVKREFKAALTQALIQEIKKAFGDQPDQSKDYGRIIHQKHFDKLAENLKDQTLLHGATLNRSDLFISPTLVDEPSLDSQLMEDEIFGPILPILNYENEDELDPILSKLKNPLAFYVFSKRKKFVHSLLVNHAFGGAVVNDSIIHFANNKLPFGGIGNSGTGAYHGKFSFDTFSHSKPVVKRPFWFDLPQRFAPFPKSNKSLKTLLKKL